MLWIALYIPELPLQIALRAVPQAGDEALSSPLVITGGADNRPVVHAANAAAKAMGIKTGISIAAARALITQGQTLRVVPRHAGAEQDTLHNLASWASQFTPSTSINGAEGLLLEVATTLRLHDGLAMLLGRIRREVHALGFRVSMGVAPTPLAAWLLAKARYWGYEVRVCHDKSELESHLADLPLTLLDWPHEVLTKLANLGIVRIADCLALPADGFTKRFGAGHWADLQRMLGRLPDPRPYFILPDTYQARAEFGFEINDALALLFPLKRLLTELEGFLRGRGAGTLDYAITLQHANRTQTSIRIRTAKVERQAERLLALAREHLLNLSLTDTVSALSIKVDRLQPYLEVSESWLPDSQQQPDSWFQLLDKLCARLGADNVYQLQPRDDHRPEQGWKSFAANIPVKAYRPLITVSARPLFLLNTPRKLLVEQGLPRCHGTIHMISGPERIESGWWDGRPASRDYYVGRNRHGETLWLFVNHAAAENDQQTDCTDRKTNEHRHIPHAKSIARTNDANHTSADWYLHGYFA